MSDHHDMIGYLCSQLNLSNRDRARVQEKATELYRLIQQKITTMKGTSKEVGIALVIICLNYH